MTTEIYRANQSNIRRSDIFPQSDSSKPNKSFCFPEDYQMRFILQEAIIIKNQCKRGLTSYRKSMSSLFYLCIFINSLFVNCNWSKDNF